MDILKTVDLLSGLGEYSSPYHPQVLEFAGGILALVDKAKTTLETMATEAVTESSLRSGSLYFLLYSQEPLVLTPLSMLTTDLT